MVTPISQFRQEMNTKVNAQLSTTLPYEPMPKVERKVNLTSAVSTPEEVNQAEEDGVLLICYKMESAIPTMKIPDKGMILAMTRKGLIIPVQRLLSYMPSADLSLFQLSEKAVEIDPATKTLRQVDEPQLLTLPKRGPTMNLLNLILL
ncbi:hypothetical protein MEQU1_002031 [Malassezia equina]|uniref:Uncharacterized protein n=1 Tax=Malassezia equina TaxID=1381935 RepID=A0AAF0EJR4_9BASI|nr:hypothetical protein MEQU1_002031 [Malassezia equina]